MEKNDVVKAAGEGLEAALIFLVSKIKEKVSVPAPRVRLPDGTYRATTPAVPGDPPRKLSGLLRNSVDYVLLSPTEGAIECPAESPEGFPYPMYHEGEIEGERAGEHPFIRITIEENEEELKRIIKDTVIQVLSR